MEGVVLNFTRELVQLSRICSWLDCFSNLYKLSSSGTIPGAIQNNRTGPWITWSTRQTWSWI